LALTALFWALAGQSWGHLGEPNASG
jgi:hypothetical protein